MSPESLDFKVNYVKQEIIRNNSYALNTPVFLYVAAAEGDVNKKVQGCSVSFRAGCETKVKLPA